MARLPTWGTTGVHSTAGSGTRCGSWGHQAVGASSVPVHPSCTPWRLRQGCTLRSGLHVEKILNVTGVTSLSHPREGVKRNVQGPTARTVMSTKLVEQMDIPHMRLEFVTAVDISVLVFGTVMSCGHSGRRRVTRSSV